jgi:SAM-dependent methyltransferase
VNFLNRIVQRKEGAKIFEALPTQEMSCAEISGHFWAKKFEWASAEEFHFPDYDVTRDTFRDAEGEIRQFDMIIADQVWEHLDRPYAATRNVLSMLKPGGYFYIAVPFFAKYHAFPVDCSRWTARGLNNLLIEAGFEEELIQADQWGNFAAVLKDCNKRWAKYEEGDDLTNDPKCPIVAWALGRKSLQSTEPVAKVASAKSPAARKTATKAKKAV